MRKLFNVAKFEEELEKKLAPLFDEMNLKLFSFEIRQSLRRAIGD